MPKMKLSDIGSLSRGKSKHRPRNDKILYGGKYPFVQTSDIKNANHILQTFEQTYNEIGLKQSKLWSKNTICITIAANIADSAILGFDACFPDSVIGLTVNDKIANYHYVEYLLQYYKRIIQNQSNGTSQENINLETFEQVYFDIPSLDIQNDISNILYSIDKKIELNNKINSELEHFAKTLYEYWFVQFDFPDENERPYKSSGGTMVYNEVLRQEIPLGWSVNNVKSCITHINTGLNPRDNFILNNGDIKYITVKNLTTHGGIDFSNCDTIDEVAQKIVHKRSDISKGDILFASIAPLGRCYLIQEEPQTWDINESVFSIRPKNTMPSEYMYIFLMSETFVKKAENSSTGSVFAGIRIKTLEDMLLVIPDNKILQLFKEKTSKILLQKHIKECENQELTTIRDFLLPMLMNGQVVIQ